MYAFFDVAFCDARRSQLANGASREDRAAQRPPRGLGLAGLALEKFVEAAFAVASSAAVIQPYGVLHARPAHGGHSTAVNLIL